MTCHPASAQGHKYIIVAVDYFTKWVETMPTYLNDGKTVTLFTFNHIIARFKVPKQLVNDHGSHFQNAMMTEIINTVRFQVRTFFALLSTGKWLSRSYK